MFAVHQHWIRAQQVLYADVAKQVYLGKPIKLDHVFAKIKLKWSVTERIVGYYAIFRAGFCIFVFKYTSQWKN